MCTWDITEMDSRPIMEGQMGWLGDLFSQYTLSVPGGISTLPNQTQRRSPLMCPEFKHTFLMFCWGGEGRYQISNIRTKHGIPSTDHRAKLKKKPCFSTPCLPQGGIIHIIHIRSTPYKPRVHICYNPSLHFLHFAWGFGTKYLSIQL